MAATATHLGIGIVAVLAAEGAKRAPDVDQFWGMEWGTTAGLGTGNAGNRVFETVTGTPAVTTSTPRTGTASSSSRSGRTRPASPSRPNTASSVATDAWCGCATRPSCFETRTGDR